MIKMGWRILLGFLLSMAPVTELRAGVPLVVSESIEMGVSFWPFFIIVIFLNSLVIPLVFLFLNFLHHHLDEWKAYRITFGRYVEKKQKTADKLQEKMYNLGYVALALFVAIPFTGTGAYTGTIVAWTLGLSKRKTYIAITAGLVGAGLITLYVTLLALGILGV
jgi:uncharacterized membrane protein